MSSNIILCETGYYRSACVECQRRKQKCNREWPCDSCRRRKVPDGCRYHESTLPADSVNAASLEKTDIFPDQPSNRASLNASDGQVLEVLAERAFVNLGIEGAPREDGPPEQKQDMVNLGSSEQLDRLVELLPRRRLMDDLIQLFINDINFHYYIVYPPIFLQEYHIWWDRRNHNNPISLQYACLLAMICSCSIQHAADDLEKEVVAQYGEPIHPVSDKIHAAVRELSGVIPVGHYHMMNVQRLIHSCYWYKAEARFVEAWHVLNQAILEAKELELHVEAQPDTISEFDREMRRRLWCILDTWDWQISSGLSRPKLIDRGGCTAELPDLTLEGYDPSPMEHMKMQSQLTRELASRFGAPKNIISTQEVQEYKEIILAWVRRYPKIYDFWEPDTSRDSIHPWIFPHRFYLYTMACLLILNPIRHYMVKSYTKDSPADELKCRADGLFWSLVLIKTQRKWVDKINGRDGRLHFIIFSIFDTAAILCTALVKDHANTIESKEDILHAIAESTAMLKALINISETATMSHDILYRLTKKLKKPSISKESGEAGRKRTKLAPVPPSQKVSSTAATSTSPRNVAPKSGQGPNTTRQHTSAPRTAAASHIPPQQANLNGYSNPQANQDGYQNSQANHTAHNLPANLDGYSNPQENQNAYNNPPANQDAYNNPPANSNGYKKPSTELNRYNNHSARIDGYSNTTPTLDGYNNARSMPPAMPARASTSAPTHAMVQPMPHIDASQMAHQQIPQMAGAHHAQGLPQQPVQMPMNMANPSFYQPMQPGMHVPVESGHPMTQAGSRPSPPMQPVGYSQQQPPPLGTGIFNMNVADDVPAIANLWDVPAVPMAPIISYSIMGHNVPVNVVPQPRELFMGQQQEHVVPELNLSNLTEAEIGGLAPLWSWHSSNLFPDSTNSGPAP